MTGSSIRPDQTARRGATILGAVAMVVLVILMAHTHSSAPAHARFDPARWWYLARASGLTDWIVLTASVVAGLLMSARLTHANTRRRMQNFHALVGTIAVISTMLHLVCVLNATQLHVGVVQLLIPFTKPDNRTAQGAGVLAFYLLVTVLLTSSARAVLPWRWWRRTHLLSVPLWALSTAHTALAGTDLADPVMYWGSVTVTGMVGALVAFWQVRARQMGVRARQTLTFPSWCVANPTVMPPIHAGVRAVISQVTVEADHVVSLRLAAADGAALPSWEPGAHIELVLPSGRHRQYSLCGDPDDVRTYRIAVLKVPAGRGGSIELHSMARVGQSITMNGPRNHFALVTSPAYVFIAGGIGITPLMAMVARVASMGCPWKLVYIGRSRANMAFIDEVSALGASEVEVWPCDERRRPDLGAIIDAAPAGAAVYCCGPEQMLEAVQQRVVARGDLSLNSERFAGATAAAGAAFQVQLQRSRHVLDVPNNCTVLQAVREVVPGISVGCEQGICGACRTTILAGEADHRDALLSNAERAAGAMLICVSRARSKKLTLDL